MINKEFEELDKDFKNLQREKKLNISSIEDLMIDNIDNYKLRLRKHIEELLANEIEEQDLISKKTKMEK